MKKLKKLWVENRVLVVLFIIVVICFAIIVGVCVNYFFGSSSSSYGERLDGIENVLITDEIKNNYINKTKEDASIKEVTLIIKGKIIYITLSFNEGISLIEAESKALVSLINFTEEHLNFYDFNITLQQDETENSAGFLIMGSRNVNGSGLIWNNNTVVNGE